MSTLTAAALFVLAVLALPIGTALLTDEVRAWLPHFSKALVRSAAQSLPSAHRERYEEEWLAELSAWEDRPLSAIVQAWSIRRSARSFGCALARRAPLFGRAAAAVGLVMFAPIIGIIGIAILATSPGPIVYRTPCVDAFGRRFNLLRFRTVYVSGYTAWTVTRVGAVLHRTNLYTLPILANFVRGDLPLKPDDYSWWDVVAVLWRD